MDATLIPTAPRQQCLCMIGSDLPEANKPLGAPHPPLQVDLSDHVVDKDSARALRDMLVLNRSIQSLSLRSTGLCCDGVKLVAEALAVDNKTLVDLDISENPKIGDDGEGVKR